MAVCVERDRERKKGKEKEREKEGQREGGRESDRKTDRQTDRKADRERERERLHTCTTSLYLKHACTHRQRRPDRRERNGREVLFRRLLL